MLFFIFVIAGIPNFILAQEKSRCFGRANLVLMIPGNGDDGGQALFRYMEDFLIKIINYLEIRSTLFNVGVLLYGKSPVVISDIRPFRNRTVLNTRITLLSHQSDYADRLKGETNLPRAMKLMKNMFNRANMERSPSGSIRKIHNIAVLLLNETTPQERLTIELANMAKRSGTKMYIVSSGSGDFFLASQLASDGCKVYYVDSFHRNFTSILPRIGNNICMATNSVTLNLTKPDSTGKCKEIILHDPPFQDSKVICRDREGLYDDKFNCAYFYKCYKGVPKRMRCRNDNVFDSKTKACNHKDAVTCYTQIICPRPTGLFPYPGHCGQFLNCFRGLPYVQSCPNSLMFDATYKRCLRPGETYCQYSHFEIPI